MNLCDIILLQIFIIICMTTLSNSYAKEFVYCSRCNIRSKVKNNILFWKNKYLPSKYQDVIDFVKEHPSDTKLIEFENILKHNELEYKIYTYKFKEGKTFNDMSKLLNMDNPRIVEKLDKITFGLKMYCMV